MKKIILCISVILIALSAYSQQKVTKFLGIPIDGYKMDMIRKLENKGFVYSQRDECLRGEFNGREVSLHVVTNNNKVYRIAIIDANWQSETDIKIRFNKLCSQFENNTKYMKPLLGADDYTIADDVDISYEMSVNNKRFEASYYQAGSKEELAVEFGKFKDELQEQIVDTTKVAMDFILKMYDSISKRIVWFMIDEQYGKYKILMFYDNELNHANGEDL